MATNYTLKTEPEGKALYHGKRFIGFPSNNAEAIAYIKEDRQEQETERLQNAITDAVLDLTDLDTLRQLAAQLGIGA